MFKSEIVNRIISLVVFLIIVFFALFNNNNIVSDPIFWSIVFVFTAFHFYGIIYSLKKQRNDSLE
ncbi:hypothetical protein CWR45_01065 [Oceanobacillus chungangensis]|uniref:Uncharacterized protein n=1 Tax=Oceanobacillus chungangensis TaxID=1229152 RepID=A0A3D8Q356_9BACI|nr:hypothetical protein CWR45_01065 [Oceanobacillus chungangensis]